MPDQQDQQTSTRNRPSKAERKDASDRQDDGSRDDREDAAPWKD